MIKELPSLVPSDDHDTSEVAEEHDSKEDSSKKPKSRESDTVRQRPVDVGDHDESSGFKQRNGDSTTEKDSGASNEQHATSSLTKGDSNGSTNPQNVGSMTKSPGEVAFFKFLHSEFRKASHFFDRATEEFSIREERVCEGMSIMKQPNSVMVAERWSLMAKSIYQLYRDLLLLETFAIMAYCSFSKILKKHDKVTRYSTRCAFMFNVVNKANFTHYPKVLAMINRCERLYEEVSQNLLQEGKGGLYEDERLFINMIHRLNEQVLSNDKDEVHPERRDGVKRPAASMPPFEKESQATSTLRSLVEEHDKSKTPTKVTDTSRAGHDCEGDDSDDSQPAHQKRSVDPSLPLDRAKKQRVS